MIIREANPGDKQEIVTLYRLSQHMSGIPDPDKISPEELGFKLYSRDAIERYVAIDEDKIVGHGMIESPNPDHLADWQGVAPNADFIELGGAFVDPSKIGRGIWSSLLAHRLHTVRAMGSIPVSVTWSINHHVKQHFEKIGGSLVSEKQTEAGNICLYVFNE